MCQCHPCDCGAHVCPPSVTLMTVGHTCVSVICVTVGDTRVSVQCHPCDCGGHVCVSVIHVTVGDTRVSVQCHSV